jgi:hypothetical protein
MHGENPKTYEVAEGTTPNAFMLAQYPETGNFPMPTICLYEGQPRLREEWDSIALSGKAVLVFVVLPGGGGEGGSNPVTTILMAVLTIFMWWNPLMWGYWAMTAFYVVASVGIGMLGQAMAPDVSQGQQGALSNSAASPTYSLNSSTNQARLNQPEPEMFGKMLVLPDVVAAPWQQYINNDFFLYQVFGLGRGLYEQHYMAQGGTKFWENGAIIPDNPFGDAVEVEIVEPGGKVTLFPDNVETAPGVAGQILYAPNDDKHDWVGPHPVNSPGTITDRILVDIVFPRGLGRYNNNGNLVNFTVTWEIEYRHVNDASEPQSEWAILWKGSLTKAEQSAQRLTQETVVAPGRYQVRARRTSDSPAKNAVDECVWEAVRAILPGTLSYPQTVVAVKMKATDVLSQAASERFTVLQTRKLPLYDPATKKWSGGYDPITRKWWGTLYPTRSFAAAVAWICKEPWGGQLSDEQIDLDGLWAIDALLAEKGWTADAWLDGPYLVWDLLVELCAANLVIPRPGTGVLSFIQDASNRPVRHIFTPHNIVRNSLQRTFGTFSDSTPDDVNVTYFDEDAEYQQRDVTAVLPESESNEESQQRPIWITSRAHAHAYGVRLAAGNRYRRLGVELQSESIGRLLNVGDVVQVKHPRFRNGPYGKLEDWNAQALTVQFAEAPEYPDFDDGDYIAFTRPDGSAWGPVKLEAMNSGFAQFNAADYAALLMQGFESPFEWFTRGYDRMPTIWTVQEGREFDRRMIITKITPQDMFKHSFSLVNDDPRVYNQDIPVPPWESRPQLPDTSKLEAPKNLRVTVEGEAGAFVLAVTWLPVPGAEGYYVESSTDGAAWNNQGRANINAIRLPVDDGAYAVRISAFRGATQSPWAQINGNTFDAAPDSPVPALVGNYTGGNLTVQWPAVDGADSYVVRVYEANADRNPERIHEGTDISFSYTAAQGISDGGPWRDLSVEVASKNNTGESIPGTVSISDIVPAEIPLANITVTPAAGGVVFDLTTYPEGDISGYVLARGTTPDFGTEETAELRAVATLPTAWDGLTDGTEYYFRLAAKDAFFDVASDYAALNYSGVITVTAGATE